MKKQILLVDDDALVLKTVTNLLQSKGYQVLPCKTGDEAVSSFRDGKFDLIITDVRMPNQDGVRTIKLIRESEKNLGISRTPVIVITGYASEDVPVEAIELGVDGYVLKPFDFDHFFNTIDRVFQKSSKPLIVENSDIERVCFEMKKLMAAYYNKNEREVFENPGLKELLNQLENYLTKLEKELIKLI